MVVNSLPKTVTRQRRDCDLNPGPSAPESSTLTTRLPSHGTRGPLDKYPSWALPAVSLPSLPSAPCPPFHPSLRSFPLLPFYSQPFPLFPPSSPLYNSQGVLGSSIAHPAVPGGARPPNALLCNTQPKIYQTVSLTPLSWECCNKTFCCLISRCPNFHCNRKILFKIFCLELGGPWTLPTLPTCHKSEFYRN